MRGFSIQLPISPRAGSKLIASLLAGSALALAAAAHATPYLQTDLATDNTTVLTGLGYAAPAGMLVDTNLINPWGITVRGTSPFWVSDNGAGVSTLYNGTLARLIHRTCENERRM